MAMVGFCALLVAGATESPRQTRNVVRQIDHILIVSSEAEELFSLLSDTFQLPVAWPMSDYGGFASGGVAVGDVNLEVIKDSKPGQGTAKSRWTGFAFEPEPLRISLPELDARGIRRGKPVSFRKWFTTRWTTVGLPEVSGDTFEIFLCQYEDDVPARRRRLVDQLQSRNGGPLSIHSLKEVVLGATDANRTQGNWQKLLNPLQPSAQGVWPIGAGPAIHVIPADKDGIQSLVISVKSLEQARRFLKQHGLPGTDQSTTLTLAGPHFQGLNLIFVEQSSVSQK